MQKFVFLNKIIQNREYDTINEAHARRLASSTKEDDLEKESKCAEIGCNCLEDRICERVYGAIVRARPEWYFADREARDVPALMRKVSRFLDSDDVKLVYSFDK